MGLRPCGLGVLRLCGLAARSELEASCGVVEAVRAGCPQRVGGFMGGC